MRTTDINGDKVNQYGQKLQVEKRFHGVTAGVKRYLSKEKIKDINANDAADVFKLVESDRTPKK